MKRALSFVLTVVVIFSIMYISQVKVEALTPPNDGQDSENYIDPGYTYRVIDKKEVMIVGAKQSLDDELTIPSTLDGLPVTRIAEYAFEGCDDLVSISLPDSLTHIGRDAFNGTGYYNNDENWENGVLYIGKHLIEAKSLRTVNYEIKKDTLTVASAAFEGCRSLTSVTVPDSVLNIDDYAFKDCSSLISCNIGGSVKRIGHGAFLDCKALAEITVPSNVESLEDYAFGRCKSLTSVVLSNGLKNIAAHAFSECERLDSVTIPNSVLSIGEGAFTCCSSLNSITVPDGIEAMGSGVFSYCRSLRTFTIPDSITSISQKMFLSCSSLKTVNIHANVTSIGGGAFSDCDSLTSITIPEGVTSIGNGAFSNCDRLTSLTIPDGVTEVADKLFRDCTSLASVNIPDSVLRIGDEAFFKCEVLNSVKVPENVTEIGASAFEDCIKLDSIKLPDNTMNIDTNVITGTKYYQDNKNWKDGVLYIGRHLIKAQQSISGNCTISADTLTIAKEAFKDCSLLQSVTVSDGIAIIPEETFKNCVALESVTIPDGVKAIEINAFENTGFYNNAENWEDDVLYMGKYLIEAKETVSGDYVIKPGTAMIAEYAFQFCYKLTSITMPDGLADIGCGAFAQCTALRKITIPDSVEHIGSIAFIATGYYNDKSNWEDGCLYVGKYLICAEPTTSNSEERTGEIIVRNGTRLIADNAITNVDRVRLVVIPDTLIFVGDGAFGECNNLEAVHYKGGEVQRKNITICQGNDPLETVEWEYIGSVSDGIEKDDTSDHEQNRVSNNSVVWYIALMTVVLIGLVIAVMVLKKKRRA